MGWRSRSRYRSLQVPVDASFFLVSLPFAFSSWVGAGVGVAPVSEVADSAVVWAVGGRRLVPAGVVEAVAVAVAAVAVAVVVAAEVAVAVVVAVALGQARCRRGKGIGRRYRAMCTSCRGDLRCSASYGCVPRRYCTFDEAL